MDKSSFNLLCGAVKHMEACLIPEKIDKAVFTTVEAL